MKRQRNHIAAWVMTFIGTLLLVFGCASQSEIKQPEARIPEERLTAIRSITSMETENAVQLEISADGPLTYSALKQPDPPAVVLYFPQTSVDSLAPLQAVGKGPLVGIAVRNGTGNNTARMEIGLLQDTAYSARQKGSTIFLSFEKKSPAQEQAAMAQASQALEQEHNPSVTDRPARTNTSQKMTPSSPTNAARNPGQTGWVNKVDFLGEADGKSTLIIGTSHMVDYEIRRVSPQRVEILLRNTSIPSYRQRPLITTRFNSAVDRVMPLQSPQTRNEAIVAIDLRESVPYTAEQTDNLLMVHFEPSSIPPKPMEQANLPAWKQVLSQDQADGMMVTEEYTGGELKPYSAKKLPPENAVLSAEAAEEAELRALLKPRQKKYSGEKIALDFYETDIKNVFRILREVSGKNFAIDKDVSGRVTMTLDKPVPWDQVLDLVLRMNQLGMAQEGEIIRIATLVTLSKEDDLRKSKLEALKKAREEVKALEPLVTRYIPVSYSSASGEVKPHIELILTKERGSVSVDEKNNQIIVTDTAAVVKQAEEIVRRIDKVTAQVVIEAKVVEVSNNFSRELGIDWSMETGPGNLFGMDLATSGDLAMNFPSASTSSIGINFSRLTGVPFVLDAKLNALDATGEGKILSSPKILTIDNKKARIKQGVEYPYLERDSAGGSSVSFKNIDLLLEVTPHVTPDNRISLTIFITKNDVAGITAGVPSVSTNEAQTELLVNDGDTVVIGGIIKSTESSGIRVPWIKQNSAPRLDV